MMQVELTTIRRAISEYSNFVKRLLLGILITKIQMLILVKAVTQITSNSERSLHLALSMIAGGVR